MRQSPGELNDDPFGPPERLSSWVGMGNFLLGIAIALMLVGPKMWEDYRQVRLSYYDGPHMEGVAYFGAFFFFVPILGSFIGAFFVALANILHKRDIEGWPRFFSALGWIGLPVCILIDLWKMTP